MHDDWITAPRRCQPPRPARGGFEGVTVASGSSERLFVRSLAKGLRVLRVFDEARRTMRLSEIAAAAGLDKSAAQRCVFTLAALGYLRQDPRTRQYGPSPRLLEFGFAYLRADELVGRATPHLMAANRRIEETVNLTEPDGTEVVYVARVPSRHAVSVDIVLGTRLPIYCTAPGRALLAHLPEAEARDVLARSRRIALTPNTLTDPGAILERLARARHDGFALADQEVYIGDISVAAAVFDYSGRPVAAVNIAVPTSRWTVAECVARLAPEAVATARAISRERGAEDAAPPPPSGRTTPRPRSRARS
jgi:PcaR/PcaU/PobR family beta-ketoadipate pathway transcriptional regulator